MNDILIRNGFDWIWRIDCCCSNTKQWRPLPPVEHSADVAPLRWAA
ncbi:MAG: hypothetical protein LH610_02960 [Sphingomonas bacterium]|nr:hypothetical protein [Sphingomonas bacterium]